MSLLETDPARAKMIVQMQGLRGLTAGLVQAVAHIDRAIASPRSTMTDIDKAVSQAQAALGFAGQKLNALDDTVSAALAEETSDFRQLGAVCAEIVAGMNARIEREMALNPPPAVEKPCAKVLQFTGPTRRPIEHGGPTGPEAA